MGPWSDLSVKCEQNTSCMGPFLFYALNNAVPMNGIQIRKKLEVAVNNNT